MDIKDMKELIQAVSESDITSFEYEDDNQEIVIKKETARQEVITAAQPVISGLPVPTVQVAVTDKPQAEDSAEESCKLVKSPLVGTFYSSASPDAEPFVKAGDHVKKGQVLGIVEAMKLMNDIESDFDGEIVEILVNNKDMVEYDQPLFKIK